MMERLMVLFEEKCIENGGVMVDNTCYISKMEV